MGIRASAGFVLRNWRKLALGLVAAGVAAGAFCWGRNSTVPQAQAAPPPAPAAQAPPAPPVAPPPSVDYASPVAYIFGNVPITRQEFGEYLILRQTDRLDNLVNKRIIEHYCQAKGVQVTEAEIEASLRDDLDKLKVTEADFIAKVLRHYNKTLYEWKEDVIRPRLLLSRLCRDRVAVEQEDLTKAYESYYGDKVDCQIIMWPKTELQKVKTEIYPKIRDSAEEFDHAAKYQSSPTLASRCGKLEQPLALHSTGDEELEKVAFNLKEGEVSHVLDTPQGVVVLKCLKHLPAERTKTLEQAKDELTKEIFDKKLQIELPKVFEAINQEARAQIFLNTPQAKKAFRQQAELEVKQTEAAKFAGPGK